MPSPTQLAKRISKSPTIAMNDKAKQLAAEGHDVIGLAGGEPDFDTPPHIVEAGIKRDSRWQNSLCCAIQGNSTALGSDRRQDGARQQCSG